VEHEKNPVTVTRQKTEFPLPFSKNRIGLLLWQCLAVFLGGKFCTVYALSQSTAASSGVCRFHYNSKDVDKLFTLST